MWREFINSEVLKKIEASHLQMETVLQHMVEGMGPRFTENHLLRSPGHLLLQLLPCQSFPPSASGALSWTPRIQRLVGPLPGTLLQKRLGPELAVPRHLA